MTLHIHRLAAIGLAAGLFAAGSAHAQADLVPLLSSPMGAGVGVQNTGDSAAEPSHLTINCTRLGKGDGGCPDIPGLAAYADPAFPNRVVIEVPALEPGETFNHVLAFWGDIPWTPGTFIFAARADAGSVVAESNEANNALQTSHTVLPSVAVAPQQPLPLAARPAPSRPVQPKLTSTNIFQQKQERPQHEPRRLPAK
ncbi:MAG: CARDB domain-containing protein [Bacteroidota bacterium]|nr:CARDB domain-containing protein [Kiloniellaceae bacterium]